MPSLYATPAPYAWFGWAVATGDFNADGKVDLAVGIPGKQASQQSYAGAATILPGDGVGLNLAGHSYLVQELIGGASEPYDRYGWALAAGNWNDDQHDDLAVGAPFENVEGSQGGPNVLDAGAVFVHYGGPNLVNGQGKILRQNDGVTPGVPEARDWFGLSLASVRLGQGNGAYLVIGIPGEKAAGLKAECRLAGAVQLGVSWLGVGPIADPNFLLHQDTNAPFNLADQRECTTATTPWEMNVTDGAPPTGYGEFFAWAVGS